MIANFRTRVTPVLIVLSLAMAISGCGRDKKEDTRSAEELYQAASTALAQRNYERAVTLYRRLNTQYPFGRHAEQGQLDMAFAHYRAREPEPALSTLDRFIRTYPSHPNIDYAWYLKGLVNYEESRGFIRRLFPTMAIDRDHEHARRAFHDFQELIQRHPDSRYVPDARQRMVYLRNNLAEYEVTVGSYYQRRNAHVAAIKRAQYVIENYPGAPATVDALLLLEENYRALDLDELAADTRRVLETNYAGILEQEPERQGFLRRLWPFN